MAKDELRGRRVRSLVKTLGMPPPEEVEEEEAEPGLEEPEVRDDVVTAPKPKRRKKKAEPSEGTDEPAWVTSKY